MEMEEEAAAAQGGSGGGSSGGGGGAWPVPRHEAAVDGEWGRPGHWEASF